VWALHGMDQAHRSQPGRSRGASLFMVQAALMIVRAPKSRIVDHATLWALDTMELLEIPDWCLDRHTRRGRQMGRGRPHFWEEGALLADTETGELTHDGSIPDPYRDRAAALHGGA
jgi:hypothetical protein